MLWDTQGQGNLNQIDGQERLLSASDNGDKIPKMNR